MNVSEILSVKTTRFKHSQLYAAIITRGLAKKR